MQFLKDFSAETVGLRLRSNGFSVRLKAEKSVSVFGVFEVVCTDVAVGGHHSLFDEFSVLIVGIENR